ncbi:MAG: DUF1559 domain-containing protein [Gemmataceae bacterium]
MARSPDHRGILLAISMVVVVLVVILLIPRFEESGTRLPPPDRQIENNFKQVAIGLISYAEKYGSLPPPAITDKEGRPLLSWRVAILPYIEGGPLHKQFHLDEPWDSPHNRQFLNKMPPVYAFPDQDDDGTRTYIQAIVGPETAFLPGAKWRFDEKDEEAPVMVIEARDAVPWTKPADVRIEPGIPVPAVGGGTAESTAMSPSRPR